ncbi:DUF2232 domain-containing protein [Methylobacterium sp. J-076]|uniref:DUF2232 domain-containing protein n=1 Tax=Methylobacterium sp. J-076 TaxID=2836655 RepID=UPI001FB9693C|nr:DUF2232 domain-containing protein [Methylobacterium sp. J-076]MCJ2013068.1 DUF2232 domain-containing protein [Methylobacterium sp. J-076]
MGHNILIGIGAGLVSALLFGVLLKGTGLAITLYLLAPLPILIVGLGWSQRAALAAAATGSLVLMAVIQPFMGLAFAAYIALPAWWLAYLALLGRETEAGLEWYPTGRLLGWIAATAALAFISIAVLSSPNYAAYEAQLQKLSHTLVESRSPAPRPAAARQTPPAEAGEAAPDAAQEDGAEVTRDELADAFATVVPALAAHGLAMLLTFYLWAAARIVRISGRLMRPWPDLPSTKMPRTCLGALATAFVLSFAPGYAGVLGVALVGAFTAVFALQGLAAFHDRSRGRPGRALMLFGMYVVLFVTQGIALIALTLFGLADTVLDRRRPKASVPKGPAAP